MVKKNNHLCLACGSLLTKDECALSQKLFGTDRKPYCLDCMAVQFNVSVDDLKEKIEEYRNEGCKLFQ